MYQAIIELSEKEYLFLNEYINEGKKECEKYLFNRFEGVKLSPDEFSNDTIEVDENSNLMLVKVYFKHSEILFELGKVVGQI
jgi:hypothetical protein